MSREDKKILECLYSLPVLTQSVAIATRTPTQAPNQESKYMPDYGGILETPTSCLKNNALATGLPFLPKSSLSRITKDDSEAEVKSSDSLLVTSFLDLGSDTNFSVIRALDTDLIIDSIESNKDGETSFDAITHTRIPHSNSITGIKLSTDPEKFLLVKYGNRVRTWKLNKYFNTTSANHGSDSEEQSPLELASTISERTSLNLKDACINPFTKSLQGVASDLNETYQVKLFDLVSSTRHPYLTYSWVTSDTEPTNKSEICYARQLRNRVVTNFVPSEPSGRGIQQLDHIPSHLVDMLITTDAKIILIDPRQDTLGQVYVDRDIIPSFYPIEYLRRTEFSQRNSYQFYSLTNVHLRAFDTRYPNIPVNQINHMLDSSNYDDLNVKVVQYEDKDFETLCLASTKRLCFTTFDQNQASALINPRSLHLPYHQPADDKIESLYGLAIHNKLRNHLFSVVQLTRSGDICVRGYSAPSENESDKGYESLAERIIQNRLDLPNFDPINETPNVNDIQDRDTLASELPDYEFKQINILETTTDLEERINSRRAMERFEKMKNKLDAL